LRCLPYTTFDPLSRCRYTIYAELKSAEKLKMATNLSEDPETGLEDLATEGHFNFTWSPENGRSVLVTCPRAGAAVQPVRKDYR
jgi:hypothetical protein